MSIRTKEMVEIFNRDTETYNELFREQQITIPAGGSIKMTRSDGVMFMGIHPGHDAKRGRDIVKHLEMKRIAGSETKSGDDFISAKDGKRFDTQKELDAHLDQFKDEVVKEPELDQIIDAKSMIKCPFCSKVVKGKFGLQIHLKAKCGNEETVNE